MDVDGAHTTASRRESSWLQQTNASINASHAQNARPALHKRQSLRLRPPTAIQNADPPSPWASSMQTERLRRPSKMSLFSLFKSPKVEKQQGYFESALPTPVTKEMNRPTSPEDVQSTPENVTQRPVSASSAKAASTNASRPASKASHSPAPPLPYEGKLRKIGPFEHPPLFQAYPQAMKEGTLEISTIPVEALNKARHQEAVAAVAEKLSGARNGLDSRRVSALQLSPNASLAAQGLPRKIFILVTSGYLLQYAESGRSDRLPEKVLSLGDDSAAFACDAVAGKHHVLQVSQAVDRDGIIVSNPGSFLARLGMRNAAAKRITSNFVLVLPNASEMDSWLTAIRQEIEVIRGNRHRAAPTRPPLPLGSLSTSALDRAPSHRYQVKRDPLRVTAAPSPMRESFAHALGDGHRKSAALTIDNIEMEANKLDAERIEPDNAMHLSNEPPPHPTPAFVDPWQNAQGHTSGEAVSTTPPDQPRAIVLQQPHDIISKPSGSARASLDAVSGTSKEGDATAELPDFSQPGISSHNFSRKAPPDPLTLHSQPVPATELSSANEVNNVWTQPAIPERPSPTSPVAQEIQNLQLATHHNSKHDSKIAGNSSAAELEVLASEGADGLGKLPTPGFLTSIRPGIPINSLAAHIPVSTVRSNGARRVASFSMPLKVNPANMSALMPSGNPRHHSRMDEPDRREDSTVGLAITPSATLTKPELASYFDPASSLHPESAGRATSPPASPSSRIYLIPSPTAIPTADPPETLQRTASVTTRYTNVQPAYAGILKRPSSMQVRSDHTPFLSSVRISTGYTDVTGAGTTAPIRGMKPSRPASSIETLPHRQSSIDALKALKFDTPIAEEIATTPRPVDPPLPLPKASSRSSVRRSRHKSPLPNLDFGIPVAGLGPPAPPPQMPLPAPPTSSRAASPTAMHSKHSSIERVAGLGISVS